MDTTTLELSTILAATPDTVFSAWLDSKKHGEMVEGQAKIDPVEGGKFTVWAGAISGTTVTIDKASHRIVQDWHYDYDDWPANQPSTLTVECTPHGNGQTKLTLKQSGIPKLYKEEIRIGWLEFYFEPMERYFGAP